MSQIVKRKVISFGKHAIYSVRKINEVTIELELRKDDKSRLEFSASGNVWNGSHTDIMMGGQCIDSILKECRALRSNKLCLEIEGLWKRNHLNGMHAGTEKQEKALEEMPTDEKYQGYNEICAFLESKGLLVDDGYKYGTAWLYREISDEDLKRIEEIMA